MIIFVIQKSHCIIINATNKEISKYLGAFDFSQEVGILFVNN